MSQLYETKIAYTMDKFYPTDLNSSKLYNENVLSNG